MTASNVSRVVLRVGDTTYLDYGKILAKRDGYGPQGKGGNGLLLHSAMVVEPEQGQPLGLLWQKMWNRQHRAKPPTDETPEEKKERPISDDDPHRLWEKLETQPIIDYYEVELSKTKKRQARKAKLAVRFCLVQLRSPAPLGKDKQLQVYAVLADEVDCPEGQEPVSWMLLTSEEVKTIEQAKTILRWYSYRWRIEEYHKLLKSLKLNLSNYPKR